jgi:HlyD family secretion protein
MLSGTIGAFLLVVVLGLWAGTSVISGAIIAMGQATVHGNPKTIQNLDGGIVAQIYVQDGDVVEKDQLLVTMDPTLLKINLNMAQARLAGALALRARLEAEQAGAAELTFQYPALPTSIGPLELDHTPHEIGQSAIFAARQDMLKGGQYQLTETLSQLDNQRQGLEGQITSLNDQLKYLEQDLDNTRALISQSMVRQSVLTEQLRQQATLLGELSSRKAELARLENLRREQTLKTQQSEHSFMESVVTDLQKANAQVDDLILEIATHAAQLDRIDLRAPAAGIVHEMQISTIGGVVAPGADIMQIVPQNSGLDFEVRVDASSADQVFQGQEGKVVFSSFDMQTTPELHGKVLTISPQAVDDPRTGHSFYRVKIAVPPEEMARLGEDIKIMPGMPIEVYLGTRDRTVLSYLTQPLIGHFKRALRE